MERHLIQLTFFSLLLGACGEHYPSASSLSSLTSSEFSLERNWSLEKVNDETIPQNETVSLRIFSKPSGSLASCDGSVKAVLKEDQFYLLDGGYGKGACHIDYLKESHHVQFVHYLKEGMDFKMKDSKLILLSSTGQSYIFRADDAL